MVKADLNFFKRLLAEIGDERIEDMLFIDDSIKKIESAKASGIRGFLFANNEQIRGELEAYLS